MLRQRKAVEQASNMTLGKWSRWTFEVEQQGRESDCMNQMNKHISAGSSSCFCKAVQACERLQKNMTKIDARVIYLFYGSL